MSEPCRTAPTGDMPGDAFRDAGHRLVDWIADYLAHPERYPVSAAVKPGEVLAGLPERAPEHGEPFERWFEDFESVVLPGITHWNHPSFFAYFAVTGSGPGILGELLSAALNVNGMLWKTSPAASELEQRVLEWVRDWVGLPPDFWGILYDTASVSTLHAIAAAREAASGVNARQAGLAGRTDLPPLTLYASELAHSSVAKAAITLGVGLDNLRTIPADDLGRMDTDALAAAVAGDRAAGRLPFCAVATAGTTSTTSVDPIRAAAKVCREHGLWLHVDAAYAGPAASLPELRPLFAGWEEADSVVLNPHKWLFTPIDASALYTRRPEVLRAAFSLVPEYLKTSDAAENRMDYGVQLGRRFRALKLWFVMRAFGQEGLRTRLREHIRIARHFAGWVDDHPDFERLAPAPFSTVCFRARPEGWPEEGLDVLNEGLLEAVNATGECCLSHTRLRGQFAIRLAVGNIRTEERHVHDAWVLLQHLLGKKTGGAARGGPEAAPGASADGAAAAPPSA